MNLEELENQLQQIEKQENELHVQKMNLEQKIRKAKKEKIKSDASDVIKKLKQEFKDYKQELKEYIESIKDELTFKITMTIRAEQGMKFTEYGCYGSNYWDDYNAYKDLVCVFADIKTEATSDNDFAKEIAMLFYKRRCKNRY